MGKKRPRFNDKARNGSGSIQKRLEEKKSDYYKDQTDGSEVTCEIQGQDEYSTVQEPNPIIVDNIKKEKRSFVDIKEKKTLSKRKKRQLVKILEKKKKKMKRSDLLKSLSEYQVSEKELSLYQPATKIGQSYFGGNENNAEILPVAIDPKVVIGKKRKKRMKKKEKLSQPKKKGKSIEMEDPELKEGSDSEDDETTSDEGSSCDEETVDNVEHGAESEERCDGQDKDLPLDAEVTNPRPAENITEKPKSVEVKKNVHDAKKDVSKRKRAIYVEIKRTPEIQAARVCLPILAEEQSIMETISDNDVVVLSGETGSGKTTQVPQFLYEAGYSTHSDHPGMIGVTEPRRVAAISMSKRVANEMNLNSSIVSYQIRFEGNLQDTTKIKFMTDGVLLKEMEMDFLLMKYSVVIIDEAHERSVFTDILIGLLSRVVLLRKKKGSPLKLIIMSATLRLDDFVENKQLFPKSPPVVKVDSRQYPVTIHFNRNTPDDYVTEAYKKVCKIHRTLKSGGILVFLTGQNEVHSLCRKLKRTFCCAKNTKPHQRQSRDKKSKEKKISTFNLDKYPDVPTNEDENGFDFDGNVDADADDDDDIDNEDDGAYDNAADSDMPLHVLPLYSLLGTEKQAKVFEPCPEGKRLCVVSTNVAETSLTIPGIKYVVDCGKVKTRCYDTLTGVSSFRITWTSKASANQRAGRAGRLELGHCYRLYSSAVFQHEFHEYSPPEILRRPADELLLLMKSMGIDKVNNFPFPTSPNADSLKISENHLLDLGALESKRAKKDGVNTVVTMLGKTMVKLPVAPRYAKMILLAHKEDCIQYMIAVVSALTVKEIFTDDVKIEDDSVKIGELDLARKRSLITQARRKWAGAGESSLLGDVMVILRAVGACEFAGCTEKFCRENGLRYKAMVEIRKLRAQLSKAANQLNQNIDVFVNLKLTPPSDAQAKAIRQILLSCLGDRVARKIPQSDIKDVSLKNAYQSCSADDPVFIHPTSSLFGKLPEYVVYQEIVETSKMYMKGITAVEEEWLPMFASYKCSFSKPLATQEPFYDVETGKVKCYMESRYGPHSWHLPAQQLDFPNCIDKFKWFATAFLDGKVFKDLQAYVPHLLMPATVMTKTWAKLKSRTEILLKELTSENVSSKADLIRAYDRQRQFLLKAYLQWMPESLHEEVRKKWPPSK